jgi:hypothetical protein
MQCIYNGMHNLDARHRGKVSYSIQVVEADTVLPLYAPI